MRKSRKKIKITRPQELDKDMKLNPHQEFRYKKGGEYFFLSPSIIHD